MSNSQQKYKDALNKIKEIVDKIENEEPDVDELSNLVKKALGLIKVCKDKLRNTEADLENALKEFE